MTFGHPEWLLLLWLVPLAGGVLWLSHKRRLKRLALVAGAQGGGYGLLIPSRVLGKAGLCLVALVGLVVALAEPRWGFKWLDVKGRGSDLVIAVDVSSSMLAQDVNPSRLERAKREILDLLPALKGDRVGLVAFAGDSFIECPLTEDYAAVRMFISYLAPDLIPNQGTDLGGAIQTSLRALFDGSPEGVEGRAILLITDGEDQESNAEQAVAEAKAKGVRIYTIGIGSLEGAPIPLPDGGFKKDSQGNMVVTKPDEQALAKVAVDSGGVFVRSVNGGMDLAQLYGEHIHKDVAQREFQATRQKLWFERFQWFLAVALVLLVGEFCWRDVRRTAVWWLLGVGLAAMAGGGGEAQAETSLKERYNRAVQAYQKGDLEGAVTGFKAAGESSDQGLAERALFNLATTQAQMGKLDDAVKSYENALALRPEDQEARENLDALRKFKEEQQKQKQQQGQGQDQKDQKNQEQKPGQDQKDQKDQKAGQDQKSSQDQQGQGQQSEQKDQTGKGADDKQAQNQAKPQDAKDGKDGKDGKEGKDKDGKEANGADKEKEKELAAKKAEEDQKKQAAADQKKKDEADAAGQRPGETAEQEAARKADEAKAEAAQTAQEGAGKEEGKEDAQGQAKQAQAGGAKKPMSEEDAEKLLRSVDDNVKRYLYAPRGKRPPANREKDW